MSKLFANPNAMLEEIVEMERDEVKRREDRAVVSAFFGGQPPLGQKEADALGLKVNVNNLFGYTDLAAAKEQAVALYTKPPRLFNVSLDNAPMGKKEEWEQKVTTAFNRAIKKSGKLRMPYEGVAGDAVLHGEGEFFFADPRSPIPRHLPLSQRLVPSRSAADVNELSHFAIQTELSIFEIMRHIRRKSEGWNIPNLQSLVRAQFDEIGKEKWGSQLTSAVQTMNPEEIEYARQESATVDRIVRGKVPVTYFYQADPSRDGRPLDLTILAGADARRGERDMDDKRGDLTLFEQDDYFPSIKDAIHPFFMDCILGGAPKWHRVKGLGHLNYSLAWHMELFFSRMIQGAMESTMEVWQASDGASREDMEKILLKHNGIVPEGIALLPNRRTFDFNGILSIFNVVRQSAAKNAQAASSNPGDPQSDELEVQAVFRQGQINAQQSSRMANWYDALSGLGGTMFSRYTSCDIMRSDAAYSEVLEFQSEMKRLGIPLYYLQPWNTQVTAYKIVGDGDEQKAKQGASFLMANIAMYPAESQQKIKRIATGAITGDYELAEQLVPIDRKPDTEQVRIADGENNTCIIQMRAPEIADTDIDEIHVQGHFQGLASILQKAAQGGQEMFTPDALNAFKALGGHTIAHVQRMESMGKEDPSRQAMEQMNQLAQVAEKFAHNMEQAQKADQEKGQQEPVNPVDVARLQLDHQKLALLQEKQAFNMEKFQHQQLHKENNSAVDTTLKLAQDARAEQAHRHDLAKSDVETALAVHDANKPEPEKTTP